MWLEVILTSHDLKAICDQFAPATIRLGANGALVLDAPSDVSLVPDNCVRVVCSAHVHWPILGIDIPVALRSLIVRLTPVVEARGESDALVFKLAIEHADMTNVPAAIDNRVTALINDELAKKHVDLAWNFRETLDRVFPLPGALESAASLELRVKAATVKGTDSAIGFAVAFQSSVVPRNDGVHARPAAVRAQGATPRRAVDGARHADGPSLASVGWTAGGVLATLVMASGFAFGRLSKRSRW